MHSHDRFVGTLRRTQNGAEFQYDGERDGREPICFRMPWRASPYRIQGVNLHPYFAGLLPEGLRFHGLVRRAKTSEDDLFTLLAATGGDAIGAVTIHHEDESDRSMIPPDVDLSRLEEIRFAHLQEIAEGLRELASNRVIAGVQPKLSAGQAKLFTPLRGKRNGTRYESILKLDASSDQRLIRNEAFCLQLARRCGLEAAKATIVRDADGVEGLLVQRFDRAIDREGRLHRFAQEDACQLLDLLPAEKYRVPLRSVFEALEVCSSPRAERLRLLEQLTFSYLIANGDHHAKNISVQTVRGITRLTPVYDLLTTLPFGDDTMALALGNRDRKWKRQHLLEFGSLVDLPERATAGMLDRLLRRFDSAVGEPAESGLPEIGYPARRTRQIEMEWQKRWEALRA